MTAFLIFAALLVAGAVLVVVPPLVRGRARATESRDTVNVAVYRDQLRELDSDLRAGTLAADQAEKARAEIEARLLEDVGEERAAALAPARSRASAIAFGIAIPLCALVVYLGVGNPRALDPQVGGGADHGITQQQLQSLAERLSARMKDNPEDAEGWVMLARSYAVLGRYPESAEAYARAAARIPANAQLLADYADALAMAQGRRLLGEPEKIVERALAADPNNIKALALAGTAAFDRKNYAGAVRHWERIQGLVPPGSEFSDSLQASITEARQLGGMRAAAGKAQAPAAAPARVSGTATLAPALAGKVAPTDTVFIFARAVEGPRIPLAVLRRQARDLPVSFVLDDSMAMSPQMKLSGQTRIVVGARVSKTANATPQAGDLQGLSRPVSVGAERVSVHRGTLGAWERSRRPREIPGSKLAFHFHKSGVMKHPSFLERLFGLASRRPGVIPRAAVRSARRAVSLCHELLSERGEVSGARIAREALAAYQALEEIALGVFFSFLVKEFSPDPARIGEAADAYRLRATYENFARLQRAIGSPRRELFRRLNVASGGIGVLMEMRRRLLRGMDEHPHWAAVEADLGSLFRSWFNRGFLVLQRIDWRTSAIVLEKLIQYEAVHAGACRPTVAATRSFIRRCPTSR